MPKKKLHSAPHEDWEHMIWFFAAHKLRVYEAHIRGIDELESSVGAFDEELHVHVKDYIEVYKQWHAIKTQPPKAHAKPKVVEREFIRVSDKLKEYITKMG